MGEKMVKVKELSLMDESILGNSREGTLGTE
jgi:hypothetical protein